MARRRPTDNDSAVAEDTLPLLASSDLANGKRRTTAEKAGRFFRTRPVSSLLIIVGVCALAMITFSVGRTVGKGITVLFQSPSAPHSAAADAASGAASRSAHSPSNGTLADVAAEKNDDDDDDDDDREDAAAAVGDDEKGTLVDGVPGKDAAPAQQDRAGAAANPVSQPEHGTVTCHRKFEPGKLGWNKTLCVTDEFFFDISIGKDPIGTMKIGVFGEVVPRSAANFRALTTCSGVFADESLCYRGDSFHRIVSNFVAQGGSKATGRSIYGPTFREEMEKEHHSFLQHAEKGVVSWAEYPIGSQFFIMIRPEATYLDGNHVVFGIVTEGIDVLDKIHEAPRNGEDPTTRISITNCGDAHNSFAASG